MQIRLVGLVFATIAVLELGTRVAAAEHADVEHSHAAATEYALDPARTTVTFEVRHLGLARHSGELSNVSGTVVLDARAGSGSLDIAVDTRSVRAGSAAVEKFLRGPEGLNVERYSEIAYRAEHFVLTQGRPEHIDGTLTLLGVSRAVSLSVLSYACDRDDDLTERRCTLEATAVFRRSDFGMTRYLAFVSDEVRLGIRGVAGCRSCP